MPYLVVVADAGRERDCRAQVRDLGFNCYMPTERVKIIKHGRRIWTERLYLGRYFFAQWAEGCAWRGIMALRDVTGLFMKQPDVNPSTNAPDPERPALVRDEEIEQIRGLEDRNGHVSVRRPDRFHANQRVRAIMGLWMGHEGEYFASRRGADVAHFDLFGQRVKIEFAPGVLTAA